MADSVEHGIAVGIENVLLELATAVPLVHLREHMVGNVYRGHVVVTLDINRTHLDLLALANNESHLVLIFVHGRLTVADLGQQESLRAVVVNQGLAVAFQLALTVHLARKHAQLEAQVVLGDFVTSIQDGGIESREFLNLENEVQLGAIVHVVDPGRHIIEQARLVECRDRILNLVRKSGRRIGLAITNTNAAKDRTLVHVHVSFDLDLTDRVFGHIVRRHLGHIQQLGVHQTGKGENQNYNSRTQSKPSYKSKKT